MSQPLYEVDASGSKPEGVASALVQAMDEARMLGTAFVMIECPAVGVYVATVIPTDSVIVKRAG